MKQFYITFLAITLLSSLTSKAQIVYKDISPDVTTTLTSPGMVHSVVSIDFDGNNTGEYNFRWDYFGNDWFMHMVSYTSDNEINLKKPHYIEPMVFNTSINTSSNWGNSSSQPFIGTHDDPNFQDLGDRYVGCKFKLGANTHYGWVRVSFDTNKKLTVKDYAYETTPNTPIKAGDTGATAAVSEFNFNNYFSYSPIPTKNTLTIENKNSIEIKKISIINLNGQKVISKTKISNYKTIINVSTLKTGLYFLRLETENNIFSKKIVVE